MKLSEFSKPALTGEKTAAPQQPRDGEKLRRDDALLKAEEEPQYFTAVTPSGIEVAYSPAPRRHYKLRPSAGGAKNMAEWREVPSVTTVLGVLDKSGPLTYWGMKVGIEGVMKLIENDDLLYRGHREPHCLITTEPAQATVQDIVDLMVHRKLTVNHVKDSAADRGVNVHGALEAWVDDGEVLPKVIDWPPPERGYVEGLVAFLSTLVSADAVTQVEAELMVGSLEHQYAGRFDLVLTLGKPVEVVTRHYPKRKDKVEEIPAGRYLMDLKTRKKAAVYNTNYLQLEAYEHAAVECGYTPTDYRAVIVVTEDGGYQVSVNTDWTFEDFLAVRKVYSVLNEREVLQILREELDATEVK